MEFRSCGLCRVIVCIVYVLCVCVFEVICGYSKGV